MSNLGNNAPEETRGLELPATVSLFGFASTPATVRVLPRSASWRKLRGGAFFAGGLLLAPLVGLVPPHAPWALGALGVGGFLGRRKWMERFTVQSLDGQCPKCGGTLSLNSGIPLRPEMSVPCPGCHHDSRLLTEIPPAGNGS